MTGILPRFLTLLLCVFPSVLFALGLGDIRLKSALNEPLDAEIELVSAMPDELTSLRAALASRETFTRYGLERPQFLSDIDFRVGRSEDGRNVLFVRSRESVSDPFLTFLVEVNWSRGRLLREYTLLMDPPVYMPGSEEGAGAPVAAPQAGETSSERSVERAPQPSGEGAPATPRASRPGAAASADGTYTVRRNDTLYQIARGLRPGTATEVNRMIVALYRANPEAFRSNMNEMRAGAILRVPADSDFDAIASSEAGSEVRRQYSEWRTSRGAATGAGAEEAARLRLVTPTEGGEGTATTTGDSAAAAALRDRVNQLEGELAETRRVLELRDAELARLQQQASQPGAQQPGTAPPVEAQPEPSVPPTAEPTEPSAQAPTEEPPVAAEPTPTPPAEQQPAPVADDGDEPGIVAWLISNWYIPVGALLILIAILYGVVWRRRQEPDYGALGRLAAAEAAPRSRGDRESQTSPVRAPKPKDQDAFLVEESGERTQLRGSRTAEMPRVVEKPRTEPRTEPKSRSDETMSSETAINLDQGDPLAEADFHMAYGLYDQAADLVRIAIEREPQRRDLKLKLLEIFFVWGNKDSFLQTARQLHSTSDGAAPGEWDKIAIMGRQIAPEDPIFSQSGPSSGGGGEVDLNLEGGENRVDLDVLGNPGDSGGGIDLDLGDAAEEDGATTGESTALAADMGLDFPLEDAPEPSDRSATTREMAVRTMETPTVEQPGIYGHDSPTVESPALRDHAGGTIKEKIDSALFRKESQSEQTAELALDDLGLDLDALRQAESEHTIESMEQTDHPSDAATMVAGIDEKSRRLLEQAESRSRSHAERTLEQAEKSPTGTWVLDDKTLAATVQLPGAGSDNASTDRVRALHESAADTARRRGVDVDSTAELSGLSAEEMDLDLDRLEQALQSDTAKQPRRGSTDEDRFSTDVFTGGGDFDSTDIDVDVGAVKRDRDTASTGTARIPASEMPLNELEPVTMSEVGTKLDLARAYMDMGDPEGARSILEEVLQEGSGTQKQEAQRLIDSLPG